MFNSRVFLSSMVPARAIRARGRLILFLLALCASGSVASLSAAIADLSDASLAGQLQSKISGGLIGVRPELKELVKRTEGKPDQATYLFLLGLSYQDEYSETGDKEQLKQAVKIYEDYVRKFSDGQHHDFARFNLGGAYTDLEEPEKAIGHYRWLYENSGNWTFRNEGRNRMASLYISNGTAGEGVALFESIFKESTLDPELRAQSAAWLLQGYLDLGRAEEILPYLRYLTGQYEAVYDPAFNITLLKSGDGLFDREEYDQAILLYSFVKSRAEIIDFYERRIRELEANIRYLRPNSESYMVFDSQLQAAKARLKGVQEIRSYDVDMRWRMARVYKETERIWESLWAFIHLYEDFPEHEQSEDFLYTAYGEAVLLGDQAMAEELAVDYLSDPEREKFRSPIVLGLAQTYARTQRFQELLDLVAEYRKKSPDQRTVAQLMNLVGSYMISMGQYGYLLDYMQTVKGELRGKEPSTQAVTYWLALSELLLADYPRASATFRDFLAKYGERSIFYEDGSYRYAISLFGEQKSAEARDQFLKFVGEFPDSSLRGEAELYLGDITRDSGDLPAAAEHYRLVIEHTQNIAFISKATFSLSDVMEISGDPEGAVEVLEEYVEEYGEVGEISEAYFRMGMILDRLDRLGERFAIHGEAIRQLIADPNRYAVDRLIRTYEEDYVKYDRSFSDSVALLDHMMEDDAFRQKFLTDRVYQYQYMQSEDGVYVDRELANLLTRDRSFRAKIIETDRPLDPNTMQPRAPRESDITAEEAIAELAILRDIYLEKSESLAPYQASVLFNELLREGEAEKDFIVQMRARMALEMMGENDPDPYFSQEELAGAPPAGLLWEAAKYEERDPELAVQLYEDVLINHPWSDSVYPALMALGDLAIQSAEESGDPEQWTRALAYYNRVTDRYAMKVRDAEPYLKKGMILSQLGRDQEAIDTLGQVLRNPAWKGLDHAKAHLELGLAYKRIGKLGEAHGFFERLIVAYGGYSDIASWAYFYDLQVLEEMGEEESVDQLLEEYRTRLSVMKKTKAFEQIEENYEL